MARELAQGGQDLALAALCGESISAKKNWIVLLSSAAATGRAVTAAQVYSARFQGAAPIETTAATWGSPSGSSPDPRVRSNTSTLSTGTVSGLPAPTDVTHFAVVQTSNDAAPSGVDYPNVDRVVAHAALVSAKQGVSNGDVIEFAVGDFDISVD